MNPHTYMEGNPGTMAAALYKAYQDSLADECRMRYVTEKGDVIKGSAIYNVRDQAIIASVHAVRL